MADAVGSAVLDGFERFDGRGVPEGREGPEIAEAARCAAVGYAAVMFDAAGGRRRPESRARGRLRLPRRDPHVLSGLPLDRDAIRAVLEAAVAGREGGEAGADDVGG